MDSHLGKAHKGGPLYSKREQRSYIVLLHNHMYSVHALCLTPCHYTSRAVCWYLHGQTAYRKDNSLSKNELSDNNFGAQIGINLLSQYLSCS